ncbi:hypothetical protein D9756_008909 [Leucocoprinus leucothites]|uniref:Uncharacterized protein n=1 Tax=Leucocoprinus leucothites TaxID=201217 RepID=A0A8H5CYC3_9AGAR|nr:hypothetical protein D9756_008909 [Leucoagaricus leucothites]
MVNGRCAVLASISLSVNPPDDTLKPILLLLTYIPHEFPSSTSGILRNSLSNYRVLRSLTKKWCPRREEHSDFYGLVFRCNTNPRVTTAHRWQQVDITARMKQPTDTWLFFGGLLTSTVQHASTIAKGFKLLVDTTNYLVKGTVSARKNVWPQNIYEVNQLYNAGVLKVAFVGLQCASFDQEVHKSFLEHADPFSQAKWKPMNTGTISTINANNPDSSTTGIKGPEIGATSNLLAKPAGTPVKPALGISRPISPTPLGM